MGILARVVRCFALVVAFTLLVSGCGVFSSSGPDKDAAAFLTAWSTGDVAAAAAVTDDPTAAAALLTATRAALAPRRAHRHVGQLRDATDRATASVDVTWDLGPGRTWQYLEQLDLRGARRPHGWLVRWSPTVVHPQLAARQRFALRTDDAEPAPVVDRAGVPLLASTSVVTVLLDRRAAGDLPAVTGALASALGPIDPVITQQSITDGATNTPDGQAYTVAVLRDADYLRVKPVIHDLPGVRFTSAQRLLAPDAGFARQVLPGVRRDGGPAARRHRGVVGAGRRPAAGGSPRSSRRRRSPAPPSRSGWTSRSRPPPRTPSSRWRNRR